MKNIFSVKNKLIVLIVLPLLLTSGLAIFAIQQLGSISSTALNVADKRIMPLSRLSKISRFYTQGIVDVAHKTRAQMLFWGEAGSLFSDKVAELDREWQAYLQSDLSSQERLIIEENEMAFSSAKQTLNKLSELIAEQSNYGMGNYIDLELYAGIEPILSVLTQLTELQGRLAVSSGANAKVNAQQAITTIYFVVAALILLMTLSSTWIIRGIRKRINILLATITAVESNNDFTLRAQVPAGDEFSDMARRFNRMMESIGKLINGLQQVGEKLNNSASELASINSDARQQVQIQQHEIQNLSQAVQQVNESACLVLSTIEQSQQATEHANQSAVKGNVTVQDTINSIDLLSVQVTTSVSGIDELQEQSESIGSVMAVIRNIAEQTNLLALNAAIEAARAGEQGRGFAVVADEVRQLASRTADSTQEIQGIVESLQSGTKKATTEMLTGSKLSQSTVEHAQLSGVALNQIEEVVCTILDKSREIAQAAQQQLSDTETVSNRAFKIDELAQQTVDLSQSATTIGNGVAELSEQLQFSLRQFKTVC